LINLYVAEQQYAYARVLSDTAAIVVFNNDDKAAEIEFDVKRAGLRDGVTILNLQTVNRDVLRNGKMRVSYPNVRWQYSSAG
jgi:hypothetical protein